MKAQDLLIRADKPFVNGYNPITFHSNPLTGKTSKIGINFGILTIKKGEELDLTSDFESAYLLMDGDVTFYYDGKTYEASRHSLFDESPIAIHFCTHTNVCIVANSDAELSVSQVKNDASFETIVFDASNMLGNEHRGQGLLNDTAYQMVRTIFDIRNRPDAKLVLGEVINFPGRWSSYPPHHHDQPKIYHYRFTEPQGYGHAESGDEVLKVKNRDTLKIIDNRDHAQCSAPGYGMYYVWIIRHLPDNPYTTPHFTEEHNWTRTDGANQRAWSGQ
jgi:5-deoxy-D-glucuronate isomerase